MDGLAPPIPISEALKLAHDAEFRNTSLVLMVAICMAESSLIPNNRNVNTDGSVDRGIAQVNSKFHGEVSTACCDDPACALKAAYVISSKGTDFTPWSTYQHNDHLRFLDEVWQQATANGLVSIGHLDHPFKLQAGETYLGLVDQGFGVTDEKDEPAGYLWKDGSLTYFDHDATVTRVLHGHCGTDYTIVNRQLYAPADGTVIFAGHDTTGFGLCAKINHAQIGVRTLYGHLTSISAVVGRTVKRGDPIAVSGGWNRDWRDGTSTGPHLHFTTQRDGDLHYVDPWIYVSSPEPKPRPDIHPDPVQLASFIVTAVNDGHPVRSYDGPSTKLTPRETWEPGSSMATDAYMAGEERGTPGSGQRDASWLHLVSGGWISMTRVTGQVPVSEPHDSA